MFVMDFQQNKPAVNAAGLFSFCLKHGKHPSVLRTFECPYR